MKYQPLDALLALPQVRVLRKLRRFDWATFEELYPGAGDTEKQSIWRALRKLSGSGFVEVQDEGRGKHRRYRITAAGKAELERLLKPDRSVAA